MKRFTARSFFLSTIVLAAGISSPSAKAVTYDLVFVGDAGNEASIYSYGAVDWNYQIGKYEVTIQNYTDFLNAVAASDPYFLYSEKMGMDLNSAGILRSGGAGSYTYSVMNNGGNSANRPITYVSWFDAARFANWMSNGQPTGAAAIGTTENGAYDLTGGLIKGAAPTKNTINPNTGSTPNFYIPSENEWYKAAFYSPEKDEGLGGYWRYATQSDDTPGNIAGSDDNQVNYIVQPSGYFSVTQNNVLSPGQNYLTDVGSFPEGESYYGTLDQNGNVWELLDTAYGSTRALITLRGGGWTSYDNYLWNSYRLSNPSNGESSNGGFRLAAPATEDFARNASAVPEPSAVLLALAGFAIVWGFRRWRLTAAAMITLCATTHEARAISYSMVTVGDAGNPANEASGLGAVSVDFRIGVYDVTIQQYTDFLNAIASSDPYGLYNSNMGTSSNISGILRSGTSGSYTYSVINNSGYSGNRPITYVSWFDSARFANWMANGQQSGTPQAAASLEDGAYSLNGVYEGFAPERNTINPMTGSAPEFFLPLEDEWYKAAYYSPEKVGGYYTYAMQTDTVQGNSNPAGEGQANLYVGSFATTQSNVYSNAQNYLTDVGFFYNSESYYGTYDQNGNVYQWNDLDGTTNASRGVAGGFWFGGPTSAANTTMASQTAEYEGNDTGFRLAAPAAVPEPGTFVLVGLGVLTLALRLRKQG